MSILSDFMEQFMSQSITVRVAIIAGLLLSLYWLWQIALEVCKKVFANLDRFHKENIVLLRAIKLINEEEQAEFNRKMETEVMVAANNIRRERKQAQCPLCNQCPENIGNKECQLFDCPAYIDFPYYPEPYYPTPTATTKPKPERKLSDYRTKTIKKGSK